jgi:tetratricopeptide (TPR) repeat protein
MAEHRDALAWFDWVLELATDHRDALLRKGMSLSALLRHRQAILVLEHLRGLGHWNAGEAHYWMAWNLRELGEGAAAESHVVGAQRLLPREVGAHELAGQIAFEAGDLPLAVERLERALGLAAEATEEYAGHAAVCSAFFTRARIHHQAGELELAMQRFESSGRCRGTAADLLAQSLERVKAGSASPERKARTLRRKSRQRQAELLKQAVALYDAAVSAGALGDVAAARRLAEESARHPRYAGRARELVGRLR